MHFLHEVMLSDTIVERFRDIWMQQTGEVLSQDDARNAAERMVAWFELLAKYGATDRGDN